MVLGVDESGNVLHLVGLLKLILPSFPQQALKSSCETLLKLMTLSNVVSKWLYFLCDVFLPSCSLPAIDSFDPISSGCDLYLYEDLLLSFL